MNSLDKTTQSLTSKLSNLFLYKNIRPSSNLNAVSFDDGEWYESTESQIWMMKNREVLFDEECYWIENINLITKERNADIKIKIYPYYDDPEIINVNSRSKNKNNEEVSFVISKVIQKAELIVEKDDFPIMYIKIEGLSIQSINDSLKIASRIMLEFNGDMNRLKNELESEILTLNSEVDNLRTECSSMLSKISLLNEEEKQCEKKLEYLQNEANQQQDYINTLRDRAYKENEELKSINKKMSDRMNELSTIETNKNVQEKTLIELNKEVNGLSVKLQEYQSKTALYSEDFSTLKVSVAKQNAFYGVILFLSLIFGAWLIDNVYEGALSLSLIIEEKGLLLKSIWVVFISRLPVILINFFLLTALSSLIVSLIKIIIKNNEETKTIKQAAYLVREVSTYQIHGLSLTDYEILEQRINSKMKLIQNLLRPESEISERKEEKNDNRLAKVEELIKSLEDIIKKSGLK
ncbi:TPA: hypothetical protein RSW51_000818 [Vibrio vulnificus]|nr:hypothetical protein [Vibrio vulnificus]HEB2778502.1 hypothetical protein [Vibrio vulnificus]